jgi:hypothetical protein
MAKAQRRELHFSSLNEILADAEQVLSKPHRTLGSWSGGQICQHLAKTMDVMLNDVTLRTPLVLRILGPMVKRFVLTRPMRPGFKLPSWAASTLLPAQVSDEEGLAHLRRSIGRLLACADLKPHPIFGKLTLDEAVRLHCRHAELHLSHIVPDHTVVDESGNG